MAGAGKAVDAAQAGARPGRKPAMNHGYSGWRSLAPRIIFVNVIAILALAGGLVYIESFRSRLIENRETELRQQGQIIAQFLETQGVDNAHETIAGLSDPRGLRVRLYDARAQLIADNWANPSTPQFTMEDPTSPGFPRKSAIFIDRVIDGLLGKPEWPLYAEASDGSAWPEISQASLQEQPVSVRRQTNERLMVLQTAVPVVRKGAQAPYPVVLMTVDTPDVVQLVRRERMIAFLVFLGVLGVSLSMSIYLARTIVIPLRQLAFAAHRVRLGRQRDVMVPRLPHRKDEIGGLARALADMTVALRNRIDATENFAADVAHELKNPLASIRSAVEALGNIKNEAARAQLFAVIEDDVRRIDRLITDISAASRLEAELSRAKLQPVNVAQLVDGLVRARMAPGVLENGIQLQTRLPAEAAALVAADADRLAQVLNNLVDNAISFSPEDGMIRITVDRVDGQVQLLVEDQGPGVPSEARDAVFDRFYSERPHHEDYGKHSGLGLSIARAIIDSLDGRIEVRDRADGQTGAAFVVSLPAL